MPMMHLANMEGAPLWARIVLATISISFAMVMFAGAWTLFRKSASTDKPMIGDIEVISGANLFDEEKKP